MCVKYLLTCKPHVCFNGGVGGSRGINYDHRIISMEKRYEYKSRPTANKLPCCECGKPTQPPSGNWNAQRVVLCDSKKCRRLRKSALQRERRRQQVMQFIKAKCEAEMAASPMPVGVRKNNPKKSAFFGQKV